MNESSAPDFKTLLKRAGRYCARRETCQYDLFYKLQEWGADYKLANQVLAELISLDFINEERYAKAFVNDKLKFRSWGPKKLEQALNAKKISSYSIQKALAGIQEEDKQAVMEKLIQKKSQTVKGRTQAIREQKLKKYLFGKGF